MSTDARPRYPEIDVEVRKTLGKDTNQGPGRDDPSPPVNQRSGTRAKTGMFG